MKKKKITIVPKKKKVKCISCGKTVTVELVEYGDGHIATCLSCGKLAYNG